MAKNGISEDKIKYVIDVETSEIDYMYRCGNTEYNDRIFLNSPDGRSQ